MMAAMRKAQILDTVVLVEDLLEYNLNRGERGVVVEVFDAPEEAYMLEFVDPSGASSKIADWVTPNQIKQTKQAAKEFLDQGFGLLNSGDLVEAENAFRQAVSLYPQDIHTIGESFRRSLSEAKDLQTWAAAVKLFEMCLRIAPTNEVIRYNLAVAYQNFGNRLIEAGKIEQALTILHRGLLPTTDQKIGEAVDRSRAAAFTILGLHSVELGDLKAAADNFRAAFIAYSDEVTRSNLAKAYFNLAEDYLSADELSEAKMCFEEALLTGYTTPALFNDYGIVLARIGRIEEASAVFENGLALTPDSKILRENLRMIRQDLHPRKDSLNLQLSTDLESLEPIQPKDYQIAA